MTQDELKALIEDLRLNHEFCPTEVILKAADELERLAQPEQEPVKMVAYNCLCGRTMKFESVHGVVAPQRTWVGLTDDEIDAIYTGVRAVHREIDSDVFARAIEAKLKELNNV